MFRQKTNPNPLSYKTKFEFAGNGDPTGNRTRVTAVKGRCLDRLTTEPHFLSKGLCTLHNPLLQPPRVGLEPTTLRLTAECSAIELSRNISLLKVFLIYLQNRIHILYICYHTTLSLGTQDLAVLFLSRPLGQALDRLVTVSSTHCCASTPALSTSSSSRGLTSFEWDISS